MPGFARWAFALAGLTALACRGEAEEAHRAEAARVARSVQQLRAAPNPAKAPFLAALEAEPCASSDARELKATCVAAYRDLLGALGTARELASALAMDAAAPPAASAAALVEGSEARLARAREGTRRCADLEGALARRYRF